MAMMMCILSTCAKREINPISEHLVIVMDGDQIDIHSSSILLDIEDRGTIKFTALATGASLDVHFERVGVIGFHSLKVNIQ